MPLSLTTLEAAVLRRADFDLAEEEEELTEEEEEEEEAVGTTRWSMALLRPRSCPASKWRPLREALRPSSGTPKCTVRRLILTRRTQPTKPDAVPMLP